MSADVRALQSAPRSECVRCHRTRKLYCYDCVAPVRDVQLPAPIRLPFHLTVWLHPREQRSKSSALHAMLLADARDVTLAHFPILPLDSTAHTYVMFPSDDASEIDALASAELSVRAADTAADTSDGRLTPLRVILLDCTWNQVGEMLRHPRIAALPKIRLSDLRTQFWRLPRRELKPGSLSSIECIYYAARQVAARARALAGAGVQHADAGTGAPEPDDVLDDLLTLFAVQHTLVMGASERIRAKRTLAHASGDTVQRAPAEGASGADEPDGAADDAANDGGGAKRVEATEEVRSEVQADASVSSAGVR